MPNEILVDEEDLYLNACKEDPQCHFMAIFSFQRIRAIPNIKLSGNKLNKKGGNKYAYDMHYAALSKMCIILTWRNRPLHSLHKARPYLLQYTSIHHHLQLTERLSQGIQKVNHMGQGQPEK